MPTATPTPKPAQPPKPLAQAAPQIQRSTARKIVKTKPQAIKRQIFSDFASI